MTSIRFDATGAFTRNEMRLGGGRLQEVMAQLSTGKRIVSAKDDAAGLRIATRMTAASRGDTAGIQNMGKGSDLVRTAESGLGSITDMLHRMRELAVQSRNGTLAPLDRASLDREFQELKQAITHTATSTTYNGLSLLSVSPVDTEGIASVSRVASVGAMASAPAKSIVDLSRAGSITIYEDTATVISELTFSINDLVKGVAWNAPNKAGKTYVFSVDLSNNTFTSTALYSSGSRPANNIAAIRVNGLQGYDQTASYSSILHSHHPGPFQNGVGSVSYKPQNALGDNLSTIVAFALSVKSTTFLTFQFEAVDQTDPGDGGGGTDPTDPGDGGGGTDPTDPGDGGGGTDPTDPGDGGGGTDPTDPGDGGGTDPTDPGDGGGGTDPTDPGDGGGTDPTDPGDGGGTDPTDPGNGGGGVRPGDVLIHRSGDAKDTMGVGLVDARADALGLSTLSVADDQAISALDGALDQITAYRAGLGATENRLRFATDRATQGVIRLEESRQRIEEADMASAMSTQVKESLRKDQQMMVFQKQLMWRGTMFSQLVGGNR